MRTVRWILVQSVLSLSAGCGASSEPGPVDGREEGGSESAWFRDIAEESGLRFTQHSGQRTLLLFPEIMGGGVALFDKDGDGDLDVYMVQSGSLYEDAEESLSTNQLFENRGDATFADVTRASGAGDTGYGMGVCAGDVDNDGDLDLYVTNVGPNVLLRNDGTGSFEDVTASAGVGDPNWGTSAAFFDFDQDGDLDLYSCNYVAWTRDSDLRCYARSGLPDYCSPVSYNAPQMDVLYLNQGDGTFLDISEPAGLRTSFGNGLGVVCGDFNGDRLPDVFVANDQVDNQYWVNRGGGRFEDQAMVSGCAVDINGAAKAGMGTCAADLDRDGDLDLMVVNLESQSDSFFRNQGGFFTDATAQVGLGTLTRRFTRFGVGWVDFDNDGLLDQFEANGRVTMPDRIPAGVADPFAEPNSLLRGTPSGSFVMVAGGAGRTSRTSRGAAFGDLNNDGRVDLVIANRDAPAEVLLNVHETPGHWLLLRVIERHGRDAVGAILWLRLGGRDLRYDVNPHYSYLASNDPRVHVGLGPEPRVESIRVVWIDGSEEWFGPFESDRIATLREGQGRPRGQ